MQSTTDGPFRGHRDRRELFLVREACALPPHLRTEHHIDGLMMFVKDVLFVQRLDLLAQRALCRTLTLETFSPREYVLQIGDIGNKFYIILTGNVSVKRPPAHNNDSSNTKHVALHSAKKLSPGDREMETVVFLDAGMGFGELALQNDDPRSATIQTSELTELLVITKENYDRHAGMLHKRFIEQRCAFLRLCQRAEGSLAADQYSVQDIIALANCLTEQSVQGRGLICRQGAVADQVIFLRQGHVSILRTFDTNVLNKMHTAVKEVEGFSVNSPVSVCSPFVELKRREREQRTRHSQVYFAALPNTSAPTNEPFVENATPRHLSRLITSRRASYCAAVNRPPGARSSRRASHISEGKESVTQRSSLLLPFINSACSTGRGIPTTEKPHFTRRVVARVGSLSPYQYFGDQEVLHNVPYPVSLLATCGAELYMMTKHDMLRRLPKKLLVSFFSHTTATEDGGASMCGRRKLGCPPDHVSYKLSKQRRKWCDFRQLLREDIMERKQRNVWVNGAQRSFRDTSSARKVDIEANKRFLGLDPHKGILKPVKMPAGGALSILEMKDLIYFSQENAHRLGRLRKLHEELRIPDKDGEFEALGNSDKAIGDVDDMFNYQTRRYWNTMSSGFTATLTKLLTEDDMEEEVAVEEAQSSSSGFNSSEDEEETRTPREGPQRNAMMSDRNSGRRSSDERRRSSIGDILRRELSKRRCSLLQSINHMQADTPMASMDRTPKMTRKVREESVRFELPDIEDDEDAESSSNE
eukprot:GEMP01014564.1.p1 GENE.GEMP01014564.1~~GEMP01014564.1.p1  ORF type:complete len:758 (+),score=177.58 GEMP01014564.1:212-2485(+)